MEASRWDRGLPLRVAAVQLVAVYVATQRDSPRRPLDLVAVALLLAGPALLTGRHRAPVLTLAASFAPPALYFALGYRYAPCMIALGAAMVSAVRHERRAAAWVTTGAGLAGYVLLGRLLDRADGPGPVAVTAIAAVLALVLTAGEVARVRGQRTREQRRARIAEERLRTARDLHDVLGHQVSLVTVHANLALRILDREPGPGDLERVRASLAAIKDVSRATKADLGAILTTLRAGPGGERRPPAGLDRLDELRAQSAAAGLAVDAVTTGEPRPLPSAVDLAAYRIVQEAVTNVRRHSAAGSATVRLGYGRDALDIEVTEGHGLAGMRERARSVGGWVRVSAWLPYGEAP
ncbi:sensor histidine kinase [Dactylosporangium sp. McL0621]|uniref:sensor histidine kinase n=1 Tax=Dactylosporangium sp. McL0621 TaxID=3415678 RepID=UPI003CF98924